MPKLQNVTNGQLKTLLESCEEIGGYGTDFSSRISQGYSDEIEDPLAMASAVLSASRSLADLAATLLLKSSMQERMQKIEQRIRAAEAKKS